MGLLMSNSLAFGPELVSHSEWNRVLRIGRAEAKLLRVSLCDLDSCASDTCIAILQSAKYRRSRTLAHVSLAYIRTVARHQAADFLKNEGKRLSRLPGVDSEKNRASAPASVESPIACVLRSELRTVLYQSISMLTADQATILRLKVLIGLTSREIADSFGRSVHAIDQAYSILRKRLRILLRNRGISETELRSYLLHPPRLPLNRLGVKRP
jgi:RNA polymerase sigma factor (sigma-70 family)